MKTFLIAGILSLTLSVICGKITLPFLRKLKAGQTVLKYVESHKNKNGTPTMGGLFFIIPSVIVYFIFGQTKIATVGATIGLAFMCVGFLDDFSNIRNTR